MQNAPRTNPRRPTAKVGTLQGEDSIQGQRLLTAKGQSVGPDVVQAHFQAKEARPNQDGQRLIGSGRVAPQSAPTHRDPTAGSGVQLPYSP